jgi:D-alanyl-D-alanine dipeptidase
LLVVIGGIAHAEHPTLSPAKTAAAANLVDIRSLVPDIAEDIKYAGSDNFVGAPVDGYRASKCYLLPVAAQALARVEHALRPHGLRLRIWDCYRPARAVAHFVRWAHDLADQRTKSAHYPDLDKSALLGDYIAPVSGHSRAATVDLTLERCADGACAPLDMGTDFDLFGPRANTGSPLASPAQRANRERLRKAMAAQGFRNYPLEWWHYTLSPEPAPDLMYDVPVE